ncbi:hypothetical protein EVAR_49096_1 [Eumeta japonica]|uniref:Uncharacterized protein n=1 Tax=Eumeta variegata TaxID=151549 RepID=A0A4C1ZUT6_EUMVA|nr:hypothetical protein EVAR_49096_1 [Eumeta japonica]
MSEDPSRSLESERLLVVSALDDCRKRDEQSLFQVQALQEELHSKEEGPMNHNTSSICVSMNCTGPIQQTNQMNNALHVDAPAVASPRSGASPRDARRAEMSQRRVSKVDGPAAQPGDVLDIRVPGPSHLLLCQMYIAALRCSALPRRYHLMSRDSDVVPHAGSTLGRRPLAPVADATTPISDGLDVLSAAEIARFI